MKLQPYSIETLSLAKKFLSSDALFVFVCNALARKLPLSLVRMGDGERALIAHAAHHGPTTHDPKFLTDPQWLVNYGLDGADLVHVGHTLLNASYWADFFCPSTSGLVNRDYDLTRLCHERDLYGEGLFAHSWAYMGRIHELMRYGGGVTVVCRHAAHVMGDLHFKFQGADLRCGDMRCVEYSSWRDYDRALDSIGTTTHGLVLVMAGPSGKILVTEAAKRYGKVVIDVGSALTTFWTSNSPRNGPA